MYDWTDDLYLSVLLSFPSLKGFAAEAIREGDIDKLVDLLMALETDSRSI